MKNNLQIIVSLLNIQARISKNPQINLFIDKCETRIKSMLLIHEMLCLSDDVSKVNFKEYIQNLIDNIIKTHEVSHIKYELFVDEVEFNIESAIPLGLIINELINNSFKHAFPMKKPGRISISLKSEDEKSFKLIIFDNGIGFDVDEKKQGSIGVDIVKLLVEQMAGKIKISSNNEGVECIILFDIK